MTHLADLFLYYKHETAAERLVRARLLKENPNDLRILLEYRELIEGRQKFPHLLRQVPELSQYLHFQTRSV